MTVERPGLSQLQSYEGSHLCPWALRHQGASLGSPCRPGASGTQRVGSHGITEDTEETWPWSQQPCSAQSHPGCVTWILFLCYFIFYLKTNKQAKHLSNKYLCKALFKAFCKE